MVNMWPGFPANTNSDDLPLDVVSSNVLLEPTEILPAASLPRASLMCGIRAGGVPVYRDVSLSAPCCCTHTGIAALQSGAHGSKRGTEV